MCLPFYLSVSVSVCVSVCVCVCVSARIACSSRTFNQSPAYIILISSKWSIITGSVANGQQQSLPRHLQSKLASCTKRCSFACNALILFVHTSTCLLPLLWLILCSSPGVFLLPRVLSSVKLCLCICSLLSSFCSGLIEIM